MSLQRELCFESGVAAINVAFKDRYFFSRLHLGLVRNNWLAYWCHHGFIWNHHCVASLVQGVFRQEALDLLTFLAGCVALRRKSCCRRGLINCGG